MQSNCIISLFHWQKRIILFVFFMILSILSVSSANAHKVTVFAWAEGDTVFVESKFAGGKKVKGGEVLVLDSEGNQLLTGKTNDEGEFSFKIPKKTSLKIVIVAGMGHQGDWTIPVEELGDVAVEEIKPAPPAQPSEVSEQSDNSEDKNQTILSPGLSQKDIEASIERALDKKLKPVMKILAESQERKPTLIDILGGVGYILGLMGIAAYVNFRRKK